MTTQYIIIGTIIGSYMATLFSDVEIIWHWSINLTLALLIFALSTLLWPIVLGILLYRHLENN